MRELTAILLNILLLLPQHTPKHAPYAESRSARGILSHREQAIAQGAELCHRIHRTGQVTLSENK